MSRATWTTYAGWRPSPTCTSTPASPTRSPRPRQPAGAGVPPVDLQTSAVRLRDLAADRDLVLVEGAGGLLVRYDEEGATIADLAHALAAAVLVVVDPALGTLNHTALTLEAMAHRGLSLAGVVIGAWPAEPDLAVPQQRPGPRDAGRTTAGRCTPAERPASSTPRSSC